MQQEVFAGLKKIHFLSQQSDDALMALAMKAKPAKFTRYMTIITEGETTNSLYIILSGKVKVYASGDKGKEIQLQTQTAGSCFGEIALLSDEPRSASVAALEKTLCGVISKADFTQWLTQHPEVAINLLGALSEKIRSLTTRVKQLALLNVYERTVLALVDLAVPHDDQLIIGTRPTQSEIANMVGASREMINKIMHELIKGGYIVQDEKSLRIEKKLPASW